MKYITHSEQETRNLARKMAQDFKGGQTLCLVGDLGAGKTAFSKGIAEGLGITQIVTSPTFVLMKNYPAQGDGIASLAHIDAYRLSDGQDLLDIGVGDYIADPQGVTIIEWADRVRDIWPQECIEIHFTSLEGDDREIDIYPVKQSK